MIWDATTNVVQIACDIRSLKKNPKQGSISHIQLSLCGSSKCTILRSNLGNDDAPQRQNDIPKPSRSHSNPHCGHLLAIQRRSNPSPQHLDFSVVELGSRLSSPLQKKQKQLCGSLFILFVVEFPQSTILFKGASICRINSAHRRRRPNGTCVIACAGTISPTPTCVRFVIPSVPPSPPAIVPRGVPRRTHISTSACHSMCLSVLSKASIVQSIVTHAA
jgi:hypothetical protein